jgi:hypothetical protein
MTCPEDGRTRARRVIVAASAEIVAFARIPILNVVVDIISWTMY